MKNNFEAEECRGSAEQKLCLACALCCNGVIFADVKLQAGDRARELRELGLPVTETRGRQPGARTARRGSFAQPCAALQGCRCGVYSARPVYCRGFECALLKAVKAGSIRPFKALQLIKSTRAKVEKVERLLELLGNTETNLPLALRFRRSAARFQAIGFERASADVYGSLTLAMHDLNYVLSERFYPGADHDEAQLGH